MSTAKPSARFLPTLTEVVQMLPAETVLPKANTTGFEAHIAQHAMKLVEARMNERVQVLMESQAQNVLTAIQDEMKLAVVDAVKQALREAE